MKLSRFLKSFAILAWLVFTAAAPCAQGRVWRVAPSGGDFTEIGPATVAASSGDVILVATALTPYAAFLVTGKALTIMSADAGKPLVSGQTEIAQLPPGGTCRVVNMRFRGRDYPTLDAYTLVLSQYTLAPTVPPVTFILSGCDVETGRGSWPSPAAPVAALALSGSGDNHPTDTLFVLDRVRAVGHETAIGLGVETSNMFANSCDFQGGEAMGIVMTPFRRGDGGPGVWANHGSFYFTECQMQGGSVPPQFSGYPQNGGDGMSVGRSDRIHTDVFVFARRTTIAGGNSAGRGGYGVYQVFTTSQIYVDGNPFIGGLGPGGQTPPVFGSPAPVARSLGALSFDRALADLGTPATLSLAARPLEPHLLVANGRARTPPPLGLLEPLPIVGMPGWFALALVATDGAGGATIPLSVPVDPALSAQTLFVQGLGVDLGSQQLIIDSMSGLTLR